MHFKKSINQDSFYIQGLRSFKDTLPKSVKKILNKKGYVYSDIINKWNYIVGLKTSNVSYPKSFKPNGKNSAGTLTINVQRGNEIDVEYSKSQIINKINSYFGYKIIDKIRLETFEMKTNLKKNKSSLISDVSKNRYLKNINNINNELIKNSLIKLTKNLK
tara:strand:+ start:303 stop:785 length:483 start_codon:yes stop_codon:yes gene_type:complete